MQLLKEVAGTRVYEERREESQKIMIDTNSKREKIQECISILEEQLKTRKERKKNFVLMRNVIAKNELLNTASTKKN